MGLHEYVISQEISAKDYPFYALIMAAMRQADTMNVSLLRGMFPGTWKELQQRYNAPGGALDKKEMDDIVRWRNATN